MPTSATPRRSAAAVGAVVGSIAAAMSGAVVIPLAGTVSGIGGVVPLNLAAAVLVGAFAAALAHRAGAAPLLPLAAIGGPAAVALLSVAGWEPLSPWMLAGPGVLLVWAMTGAAIARAVAPPIGTIRSPRTHAAAAMLAAAAWLAAVATGVSAFAVTGDAPHYLTIARSLAVDGDLDLKNDYDTRSYADFYGGSLEPRHTDLSPWGEHFSFHGIGVGALVAPGLAALGVAGATATLIVVMSGASGLLWLAAWHLFADAGAAWFAWAALVTSAPFSLHAAALYPDGPAAAAVAAALWLAARLQRGSPVSLPALVGGSIGLAALPWLHVRLAWPAGVLGAAIALAILRSQPMRWTRVAWFFVVPSISLAGWLASTYVMFGSWNPTAVMLQRTAPSDWSVAGRGLLGLAADVEFGLVPAAPVMAAALWAAGRFARVHGILGAATVVMTGGVFVMSSLWVWWGGDSAPARFLTVTIPALALWLGHAWSRQCSGGRRALALALAASMAMTVLYATVDGGARAYTFPDGRATIAEAFSHAVDVSLALPSLFRADGSTELAMRQTLVWLVTLVAAWLVASRMPATYGEGTATGLAGLGALACLAVGTEIGWRLGDARPATPGVAALALVRAATAPGMTLAPLPAISDDARRSLWRHVQLRTPESAIPGPPTVLYLPNVPAGTYEVRRSPEGDSPGALVVELGRDAWPFVDPATGTAPRLLRLDTAVHSVRVIADPAFAGGDVWLVPLDIRHDAALDQARRVTRMGEVVVYSMDDSSFVELTGLWTGGNRSTRLLVASSSPDVIDAHVEAGPVGVSLRVHTAAGEEHLSLAARERSSLRLPAASPAGVVDLRIDTIGGFPASALGNAGDPRTLGAWLSFSPAATRRPPPD